MGTLFILRSNSSLQSSSTTFSPLFPPEKARGSSFSVNPPTRGRREGPRKSPSLGPRSQGLRLVL